jgi:hypothetical protein
MNAATTVCNQAKAIASCLEKYPDDVDSAIPSECADVIPEEYRPELGDTQAERDEKKQNLTDLCSSLKDEYEVLEDSWNSAENAAIAFQCACDGGGWKPTNCNPKPPGSCNSCPNAHARPDVNGDGTPDGCEQGQQPSDMFENNAVIPSCPVSGC